MRHADYDHADEYSYQHKRKSQKHRKDRQERRELIKARKEARK